MLFWDDLMEFNCNILRIGVFLFLFTTLVKQFFSKCKLTVMFGILVEVV